MSRKAKSAVGEDDVQWVLNHCKELQQSGRFKKSCPVFFPGDPTDVPLYDELVRRGVFVVEPLEGGYMFAEEYTKLYASEDMDGNKYVIDGSHIATSKDK